MVGDRNQRQRRDFDLHSKRVILAGMAEVFGLAGVPSPERPLAPQVVELPAGHRIAMNVVFDTGGLINRPHLIHIPALDLDHLAASLLSPFALVTNEARLVAPVVSTLATVGDSELRTSLATLAIHLAPRLSTIIVEHLRRADMTDLLAELKKTDYGQGLVDEGRQEGALSVVVDVLASRFPASDAAALTRTATRLVTRHGRHAGRAALELLELDS